MLHVKTNVVLQCSAPSAWQGGGSSIVTGSALTHAQWSEGKAAEEARRLEQLWER